MDWEHLVGLIIIVGFGGCWYFWQRYNDQRRKANLSSPVFRPIAAYEKLPELCAAALESGRGIQLNWGNAPLGGATTPDSLATLQVLQAVARTATLSAKGVTVVSGDPTALLLAQDVLQQAYLENPNSFVPYQPQHLNWHGDSAFSAVAGMQAVALAEKPALQISFGAFGSEAALLTNPVRPIGQLTDMLGTTTPNAQSLSQVLTPQMPLLGEDVYAAGAYLNHKPEHIASLQAQDTARAVLIAVILLASLVLTVQDLLR